jgi:uncharacterized protein (DUF433 family)
VGQTVELTDLITSNRAGAACDGLSAEQALAELPDLEVPDLLACLRFASRQFDQLMIG